MKHRSRHTSKKVGREIQLLVFGHLDPNRCPQHVSIDGGIFQDQVSLGHHLWEKTRADSKVFFRKLNTFFVSEAVTPGLTYILHDFPRVLAEDIANILKEHELPHSKTWPRTNYFPKVNEKTD